MGMTEAFEKIVLGLIMSVVVGGFIVGLYPTMSTYFGNTQVFVLGSVVMFIFGIIGLLYVYGVLKSSMDEIKNEGSPPFMG